MVGNKPVSTRQISTRVLRCLSAALALAAGYLATVHSFAQVVARQDPVRAHAIAPWDGQITAAAAELRFAKAPDEWKVGTPVNSSVAQLAWLALRQDAMAIPAVVTLGLQAQGRGDLTGARRWFAYSQTLSRRDMQTQLWAIENAVARQDVPSALLHYDIALRTSKNAPELLYPVLANAISSPIIRSEMIKALKRQPTWGQSFITYLAESNTDLRSAALLLIDAHQASVEVPSATVAKLVNALLNRKDWIEAWRLYASVRPGAQSNKSRDPQFERDPTTSSIFDWVPQGDGIISTSIQSKGEDKGGLFDFAVPPSTSGALLHQMQVLPPGRYRLDGHSVGIVQPAASLPYWVLTCREGIELGRIVVPSSQTNSGHFSGVFDVPSGCPVQDLSLIARSSDEMAGISGQIDNLQLSPVIRKR